MKREVLVDESVEAQSVEEQSVDAQALGVQAVGGQETGGRSERTNSPARWHRVAPRKRLAVAAIVSAFVATIAVVGGARALAPVSVDGGGMPTPELVVAAVTPTTTGSPTTSTGPTGPTSSMVVRTDGPVAPSTAVATTTPAVSSPAVAAPVVSSPGSIHDVDLRNFAYPAALCPEVSATDGVITMHDGVAGVRDDGYVAGDDSTYGHGATIDQPASYGDVTGDGVDDASVLVRCYYLPGESYDTNVAVVSITPAGPTVVATLGEAGVVHSVTNEYGTMPTTYGSAMASRAEAGHLVVDWFDQPMGPRYSTSVTYRFEGGSFVAVSDTGPIE